MSNEAGFQYRGARAMVILHERHMREFLQVWRAFVKARAILPETDDSDYVSPQAVLRHVLRAARGYMVWMCEKLQLPDPGIHPVFDVDQIEAEAEAYLEHLLQQWRSPLCDVPEERFGDATYESRWGVQYCIDSMLEHAVMHPIRHTFQLGEILDSSG
jgi:uncharacterized damage-inducible protein DinB